MNTRNVRPGSVLVAVMIFAAVFACLVLASLSLASGLLRTSSLRRDAQLARAAAESGLGLMREVLPELQLPNKNASTATMLEAIEDGLNEQMQATIFGGHAATASYRTVTCPTLTMNFSQGTTQLDISVSWIADNTWRLSCEGCFGEARQTVTVDFLAEDDSSLLSQFGVASRSRIVMKGNAVIDGLNDPDEGSVLSTNLLYMDPIDITGSVYVSGDAAIVNPDGNVALKGNSNIGGDVLIGVREPPFPEIDTSVFEPYAVNTLDPNVSTYSSNVYIENARVPANTNPTFSADVLICGVLYIESPNKVHFTGGTSIYGVIVAEPPQSGLDLESNVIEFSGNTSSHGPQSLPYLSQFLGLRQLTGSFLLAPGYEVEFGGSFSTINGSIAASRLVFSGDATGTIRGSVINYHDTDFEISGSSHLTIDHSHLDEDAAGLIWPRRLVYVPQSYNEP